MRTDNNQPVSSKLLITLAALVVTTLLICGWLLNQRPTAVYQPYSKIADGQSEIEKANDKDRSTKCKENEKLYDSQALGVAFCYDKTWGSTTLEDAKLANTDVGKRWLIGFTTKREVKLGLVSSDWKTAVGHTQTCFDPVAIMPSTRNFSPNWVTAGQPPSSAYRSIENQQGSYYLEELTDTILGGACLRGYNKPNIETYSVITVAYFKEFGGGIIDPIKHMQNPIILIPVVDREAMHNLTSSIESY